MLGKSLYLGEHIELSAIDAEKDAAAFSVWSVQPQFNRRINYGFFRPITEHEMKKKMADLLKNAEEKRNAYYFAIRKREGRDLIGLARFIRIFSPHQLGTIQIDFGEQSDLIQYGKETMELMLRYGFMEVNLHRIETVIPAYETELISLFEGRGFLREVQRREAVFHSGRYWDELIYALLKPEYKKTYTEVLA